MSKFKKMARYIPGLYSPEDNLYVKGLLTSWSDEDDKIVQAVQDAKEQIYVLYAQLGYLDALGSNVGVFRPTGSKMIDDQFRELIPALSWYPKQVRSTIEKVLEVFFGEGNPAIKIFEVNPNEIVIQIPSSTPSILDSLKGTSHLKDYSGTILSIDNVEKKMLIDFNKDLKPNELLGATFGQNLGIASIKGNSSGAIGTVTLQFESTANLGIFNTEDEFVVVNVPEYPGVYMANPEALFTVTKQRAALNQDIEADEVQTSISMQNASGIPNESGKIVLNYGRQNEEVIEYYGRPNNSTLLIDPSYEFLFDHSIGDVVNVIADPYQQPNIDGSDYSMYVVGALAARIVAQDVVESVRAAGVVIRWEFVDSVCTHNS